MQSEENLEKFKVELVALCAKYDVTIDVLERTIMAAAQPDDLECAVMWFKKVRPCGFVR